MQGSDFHKFFISIILPSILAIGLFILSIFVVILPSFEKSIMDEKKQMISELTNTAWSLIEEYNQEYQNQKLTKDDAQKLAASRIEKIRYGGENKDYFWIIDKHPVMIMHPYRSELINSDLTNYEDPDGNKLFIEATRQVSEKGEGFIDYMWQWKDDSTRIVPKLSYVKEYKPWGWIIGTGIYLEDVKEEIKHLKFRLLRLSFFITLVITIILLFVVRQSLNIENQRKDAESKLLLSRQKYKSLVEASTEGTLMMINREIIFSNIKFSRLIGYDDSDISSLKFEEIFTIGWDQVISSFDDPKRSLSIETKLKCNDASEKDVVISVSKIKYGEDFGYIIITKEVTQKKIFEKETENLSQELQTSLLMMNQPILCFVDELVKCSVDTTIQHAAGLMIRKKKKVLFISRENEIIGVLNSSDFKKRVVAENVDTQKPVIEIMTSPVVSISETALLYEAIIMLKNKGISHLAVKNQKGIINGVIGYEDITKMQQNSVSFLIKEIEIAEDLSQLLKVRSRLPVLVNALVESGDKTKNITRVISSVADSITNRIISLSIEKLGPPPCDFAFMVLGSEGRMEQTLFTDQDNAIVFKDVKPDKLEGANSYFRELGKMVCNNLSSVGYRLCDGDHMAKNPKWNQPLAVWKDYFHKWINNSDPQSILDASIFFDFRCVFGSDEIINDLRGYVSQNVKNKSVFFYHLAQSIIKFKLPVSIFGNIKGNNQSKDSVKLDIKKILLPVVGFIRLYALYHQIDETNSLSRLKQLYLNSYIHKSLYEELVLTYSYLMQLRFRFQSKSILKNEPLTNTADIKDLTHIEITTLKKIFGEISNLQTKLNFDFKGTM